MNQQMQELLLDLIFLLKSEDEAQKKMNRSLDFYSTAVSFIDSKGQEIGFMAMIDALSALALEDPDTFGYFDIKLTAKFALKEIEQF